MKFTYLLFIVFVLSTAAHSQSTHPASGAHCLDPAFHDIVDKYLDYQVAVIDADEVKQMQNATLLDVREPEEYQISHIPNAIHVGYTQFDPAKVEKLDKEATIVVYCSIGYRSEKIGAKLKSMGFKRVYNLYGSIFEWANRQYPLVDGDGHITNKVHTYNKKWSRWVIHPDLLKIW